MENTDNPYIPVIHRNLPRLLSLFNTDSTDLYFGCGDRRYWAWKLTDFPNGTYQGSAFGLAKLVEANMLPPELDEFTIVQRINSMIQVIPRLVDRNGALAEALPNEASFCVTGLVLGDCLGAIQSLGDRIPKSNQRELLSNLDPLANFLYQQDETHGIISNHCPSSYKLALVSA
jgi:hypothetical protein